jgi:hypothetical protein
VDVKRIDAALERETPMLMMKRKPWLIALLAAMLLVGVLLLLLIRLQDAP